MSFLRQYLIAIHFFTRVPMRGAVAQWVDFGPQTLRASAAHFPGVGLMVGLVACTVFALLEVALPGSPYSSLVAAVAATAATVLLTGAFHEEGLTHVADGLAGRIEGDKALELNTRPRLGAGGALALILALLAKVALLAVLAGQSPAAVLAALLAGHVVSRFWPLLLMRTLPYTGDASTAAGKPLADPIDSRTLAIAAGWCVLPLANALLVQPAAFTIVALLLSGLALLSMQRLFARRLKGFTADCVGATQQVCEIAFYLGAAIGLGLA